MKSFLAFPLLSLLLFSLAGPREIQAQGRPIDWPLFAGDAQRTGWEKADSRITRENVKDFRLVLKQKLDNPVKGAHALSVPVVIGLLISYRGFKELAFVSDNSNHFLALDADLERTFWQRNFEETKGKAGCAAASTPALIPPVSFAARRGASVAAPADTKPKAPVPAFLNPAGFGAPRPVFTLANDGKLHILNTANGEDLMPAMQFVPAHATASSLTFADGFVYATTHATTTGKCGGGKDAIWALDLAGSAPAVTFAPEGGGLPELGGLALGTDGTTLYTRTGDGSVLALSAKDLKLTQSFHAAASGPVKKAVNSPTPVVFPYKDRDVIVSASSDGRLVLLDSQSMTTPLVQTEPVAASGKIWGGLSSWLDGDGTRWIYAPVWGKTSSAGSIVAFKLEEKEGRPVLTQAWVSENMSAPEPPVIASGMVFALSAGNYSADERPKGSSHATLYALDAATGKEMYSTQDQVTLPASLSGVTVANGRVYFTTVDSTLWAFGVFLER